MSGPKDGGPAFPHCFEVVDHPRFSMSKGLTMRDWFAGQALAGMAGVTTRACYEEKLSIAETKAAIVRQAFGIADAMLIAREEKP